MESLMLLAICILLGVVGQVTMKIGMNQLGKFDFFSIFSTKLFSMFFNPYVLFGILCYAISLIFWLILLSREELSFIYPLISISYIIVALIGWIFFQEKLTFFRFLGIMLIVGGVYLIMIKI